MISEKRGLKISSLLIAGVGKSVNTLFLLYKDLKE